MSDPGTTFLPTFSSSTNRFSTIPSGTLSYDANGNLTSDGFHTYGWDADGNLITVDGVTGTFDALDRRVEIDSSGTYSQMVYPPFAPTYQMALASGTTATGTRMPLPGGGEAIFNSAGLSQYRHPNWQGSQVALSWASGTPNPNWGGAFTAFGEKYAHYSSGYNGYFAGMLGIADEGTISDAYQATARLYHQAEGRWVSPDPAGLGAVDLTNPQSWNRYAYVLNDPLDYVDPEGLFVHCEWGTDGDNNCLPDPDPGPPVYCQNCGSNNINVNLPSGGRGSKAPSSGRCLSNVGTFVKQYQANAQTLANSLGNGVTAAEVLAVAGNESTYGTSSFAAFGNFFGLHGNGPAGTYYTTQNHTAVMMFNPQGGFMASGQVFVGRVGPFMTPGLGANPLAFFTVLNHHGYATGNSAYPRTMTSTSPRGPYTLVSACIVGR